MNKTLINKILDRLTLEELHAEIVNSDEMIYSLGIILVQKRKDIFIALIRRLILETIKNKDSGLSKFLKTEIINMDGSEGVSVNTVTKRKVAAKSSPVIDDPCFRGRSGPTC